MSKRRQRAHRWQQRYKRGEMANAKQKLREMQGGKVRYRPKIMKSDTENAAVNSLLEFLNEKHNRSWMPYWKEADLLRGRRVDAIVVTEKAIVVCEAKPEGPRWSHIGQAIDYGLMTQRLAEYAQLDAPIHVVLAVAKITEVELPTQNLVSIYDADQMRIAEHGTPMHLWPHQIGKDPATNRDCQASKGHDTITQIKKAAQTSRTTTINEDGGGRVREHPYLMLSRGLRAMR